MKSDGFALPDDQRSPAWKARARDSYGAQQLMLAPAIMPQKVRPLFRHYYVVRVDG
jgi:hypothetical protein